MNFLRLKCKLRFCTHKYFNITGGKVCRFIINNLFSNRLAKFAVSFVENIQFSVHCIGSIDPIYKPFFNFLIKMRCFPCLLLVKVLIIAIEWTNERERPFEFLFSYSTTIGGCSIATAALDVACCMNFQRIRFQLNWTERNANFRLASRREF